MPEALTPQMQQTLEQRLRTRYAELTDEVRRELLQQDEQRYLDIAGKVHDPGDESVADLISDMELAVIDRNVSEIRAIEGALGRFAEGTYGICSDCGEPIAPARLEAYPTAVRCFICQQRFEQDHGSAAPKL